MVTQNSSNMGQWDVTMSVHVVCLISSPGGILFSLDAQHTHICVVHNSSSKWSNSEEAELTCKFLILHVSFTNFKVLTRCCRFNPNLGCLSPFATDTDDLLVTLWMKLLMVHTKQRGNPHRFSADLLTPQYYHRWSLKFIAQHTVCVESATALGHYILIFSLYLHYSIIFHIKIFRRQQGTAVNMPHHISDTFKL